MSDDTFDRGLLSCGALAGAVSRTNWLWFVKRMRFKLYPGILFGGTLPPL